MKIELGSLPILLFITFLVLKLCNVINWSWWWVTSPLWIVAGIVILCVLVFAIINIVAIIVNNMY